MAGTPRSSKRKTTGNPGRQTHRIGRVYLCLWLIIDVTNELTTNWATPFLAKPWIYVNRWFWEHLPDQIQDRSPPQIHGEELVKLMEWKLKRGKWRPKLLDYAKSAKEEDVRESSQAAFEAAGKITDEPDADADVDGEAIRDALRPLTELKGVGPATASAILTAFSPHIPFMSDEAMAAALTGPKQYTPARYLDFAHALRLKAHKLTTELGRTFSAQDVEKALWSEALGQKPQKKAAGKRKR